MSLKATGAAFEGILKSTICDKNHQSNKASDVCFLPRATVRTCDAGVRHAAVGLNTTSSCATPIYLLRLLLVPRCSTDDNIDVYD